MYPKTISLVVANVDEEKKVRALGLKVDGEPVFEEFPKMLYKGSANVVVANAEEEKARAGRAATTPRRATRRVSIRRAGNGPLAESRTPCAARCWHR